jgi:TrmH family RNA methyltransferase
VSSVEPLTPRSSRVKSARKLTRRAFRLSARRFLAEGPQAVREALARPGCADEVFATAEGQARHLDLYQHAAEAGVPWHLVDDAGLAVLVDTVSPQGVVAVCRFIDVPLADVLAASPRLVAVCAHLRDPGNAGSLIRSADAAGADAVILAGESVDPYNGKTVRSSVGSLFHLPVVFGVSVEEVVAGLHAAGVEVLAADGGGENLDDLIDRGDLQAPTGWLFGNEAWGLPAADTALADRVVGIPLYGAAESLNVSTAAAVCLYASARAQRSARR